MAARHLIAHTRSAPIVVPVITGLVLHYQPSGIQSTGASVTGWKNEVGGAITAIIGSPTLTAANASFNNQATVEMNQNNSLGGVSLSATDGLTIISVDKYTTPASNGDGCMAWSMDTTNGTLDLWTNYNTNTRRGLNGFASECFGFDITDGTPGNTEIMTVTIPVSNTAGALFYRDGVNQPAIVGTAPYKNLNTVTVYPGYVPNATNYSFQGSKAEFRVYNRILTAGELIQVHNQLKAMYAIV